MKGKEKEVVKQRGYQSNQRHDIHMNMIHLFGCSSCSDFFSLFSQNRFCLLTTDSESGTTQQQPLHNYTVTLARNEQGWQCQWHTIQPPPSSRSYTNSTLCLRQGACKQWREIAQQWLFNYKWWIKHNYLFLIHRTTPETESGGIGSPPHPHLP